MVAFQTNSKEWLDKLQSDKLSNAEKEELQEYIRSTYKDKQLEELMAHHWSSTGQSDSVAKEADLSVIESKLLAYIAGEQAVTRRLHQNWKPVLMRVAAVLFIPLLLVSSFLFYTVFQQKQPESSQLVMQEVIASPGSRVHFTLPDKTEVWLNSASKLEFPVTLGEQENRVVSLYGQGYFKVAPDKERPFMVKAGEMNIQVLGTSFDVANYENDCFFNTTLEEGKIALLSPGGKPIAQLVPGEQATMNKSTHQVNIKQVDTRSITSWKDGFLLFDNTPLPEVVKQLERWYNCEIQLEKGLDVSPYSFKATIQDETLGEVLKMIEISTPLKTKITNRNVTIWID